MPGIIQVISLGPGAPEYILPVALSAIAEAEVIACGSRHLESFDSSGKETYIIGSDGMKLSEVVEALKAVYETKKTAVVVSGDCGFYSLLRYLKTKFPPESVTALPGISSLQYLFAKIATPYQDAALLSLHGREQDLLGALARNPVVGMLTDDEHSAAWLGGLLIDHGYENKVITVGEDLSYPEERITRLTPKEALTFAERGMSVMIVSNE